MASLRAKGGAVFVADAGNLYARGPQVLEVERRERQLKAELIAATYEADGIDAMLPSAGDWALGRATLEALAESHHLPYVVANLSCDSALPFPPHRVVERDGRKVAFVGVVGPDLVVPGCQPTDPGPALQAAKGTGADVVVVLSGQHRAEDAQLLERVEGVDVVLNGRDRALSDSGEPVGRGAMWVGGGDRGRQLTLVHLEPVAGLKAWRDLGAAQKIAEKKDKFTKRAAEVRSRMAAIADEAERNRVARQLEFFQKQVDEADVRLRQVTNGPSPYGSLRVDLVDMGTEVADAPATQARVVAAKAAISGVAAAPLPTYEGPFIGSAACAACHAGEDAQWQTTAHAHAWQSLVSAQRQGERDCTTCHSTGAFHPDGPALPAQALPDVGCEACHGPGRDHVADPKGVPMTKTPETSTCVVCHDSKNDGGRFVEAEYRAKVAHAAAPAR